MGSSTVTRHNGQFRLQSRELRNETSGMANLGENNPFMSHFFWSHSEQRRILDRAVSLGGMS